MTETDLSNGWEDIAAVLIGYRTNVGLEIVQAWARALPTGASIIDIGCGSGQPIAAALIDAGFDVAGVDAAPSLVAAFRENCPTAQVACEAAEQSDFFGREFDGAVAIGLMFLLPEKGQRELIRRAANAFRPGGRFLFTAPEQTCTWNDLSTGRPSRSLGKEAYLDILATAGLALEAAYVDEGENHYYAAIKAASA